MSMFRESMVENENPVTKFQKMILTSLKVLQPLSVEMKKLKRESIILPSPLTISYVMVIVYFAVKLSNFVLTMLKMIQPSSGKIKMVKSDYVVVLEYDSRLQSTTNRSHIIFWLRLENSLWRTRIQ